MRFFILIQNCIQTSECSFFHHLDLQRYYFCKGRFNFYQIK